MFVKDENIDELKCPGCNENIKLMGRREIVEAFEELVKDYGTNIEIISRDTREGEQLYQMGGLGALLRYKL